MVGRVDPGAQDAAIAVSFEEDGPPVRLVATTLPFFFWVSAVTGSVWVRAIAEGNAPAGS